MVADTFTGTGRTLRVAEVVVGALLEAGHAALRPDPTAAPRLTGPDSDDTPAAMAAGDTAVALRPRPQPA